MTGIRVRRVGAFIAPAVAHAAGPVRVLAVFPRHLYIIFRVGDEDVTAIICAPTEQDGPLCIVLEQWPDWTGLHGQYGFFQNGILKLGLYNIIFQDFCIFPSAVPIAEGKVLRSQSELIEIAQTIQHGSEFLSSVLVGKNLSFIKDDDVLMLETGLRENNASLLQSSATALAGVGMGLTPAGDDFLCGVMLAAWFYMPEARALCAPLRHGALGMTTTLSYAFLDSAAAGHASAVWCAFLDALKTSDHASSLYKHMVAVVAHGATSGADALAGFLWAAGIMQTESSR
ncbi:DUF2877 domain-containing protein [Acetobacter vaccinii]|uniref:DUF2877 domain-containing protein n=1 Tax=Acetobacter vaccinii TaxID=2592655 RepID=A0A5C1YQU4_9PROT|nr:DUF2877 domain-containing protein [Acetobacter vaccinii]QEO17985.1 DUF2877 domain-containing protein [Acetobacter vaccinii]